MDYSVPPFVGVFRDIYDLEDYRSLKMTKTELENYAMLVMKLGTIKMASGRWISTRQRSSIPTLTMCSRKRSAPFCPQWLLRKLDLRNQMLEIRIPLAEAEQNLFTSAGVSTLLFNNDKASSNALLLSIKSDQALTYGIVKSIESVVNRFIHSLSYGKNFKVTFLDVSPWNRSEMGDQYLKAAQYGFPHPILFLCVTRSISG